MIRITRKNLLLIKRIFAYSILYGILFLVTDSLIGEWVLKKTMPIEVISTMHYDPYNPYYDHSLKPNLNTERFWNQSYSLCSDNNGWRMSCSNEVNSKKKFKYAFIGDSFTEGLGVSYEKSFVGIFQKQNPSTVNLGVMSYAPTIYYEKIKYFISKGFQFENLIVAVDMSDIQDESINYSKNFDNRNINIIRIKQKIHNTFPITSKIILIIRNINTNKQSETKDLVTSYSYARSSWGFNPIESAYGELGVDGGINRSLKKMTALYELAKKNKIKLSVAVYPWPNQMKYELKDSKQVQIWQNFCEEKCEKFVDIFKEIEKIAEKKKFNKDDLIQKYYIEGDVHFNLEGNELTGKALIDAFKE